MDWTPPFKCCYHCGSGSIRRIRPTAFECEDCGGHLFINPVSAAAGILIDRAGRVLLIKRAHEPAKGRFGLPGGFLDPGETAEEGLSREVKEEVGMDVSDWEYLCGRPNHYQYGQTVYHVLDLFFVARVASFDGAAALDEVESLAFVPLEEIELESLAFPSVRQAVELFRARAPGRPEGESPGATGGIN